MAERVTVIGAGLVGSVLAMFLAKKGLEVEVFEVRSDPRHSDSGDRALHLGIAARGLHALRVLGIDHAVVSHTIPMPGRIVHHSDGSVEHMRYGIRKQERQQAVPRGWLNQTLVHHAAQMPNVKHYFQHRFMHMDFHRGRAYFLDCEKQEMVMRDGVVFGAGGAHSPLRGEMLRLPMFEFDQSHIQGDQPYGYKEISIPPSADGGYSLEEKGLHLWPRGECMFLGLPNPRGIIAGAVIMPFQGPVSFDTVRTADDARLMFAAQFPDLLPLIPDVGEQYTQHPVSSHFTVHARPWHFEGKAVLVGDAAHAMVPFFGQGMNCGFEDCFVMSELIDEFGTNWAEVFPRYEALRYENARAISDLSLNNFIEMRKSADDPRLSLRWNVEQLLERKFPDSYITHYSLIVHHLVPYTFAAEMSRLESAMLDELLEGVDRVEDVDLAKAERLIHERLGPMMRKVRPELMTIA